MSNVKTIPMSTDEIQDLFLNPGSKYDVDLRNSKLKGEALITYLANMKMKCSLVIDPELSKEEKFTTLTTFLTFNYFVDCDTLINTSVLLLLKSRQVPVEDTVGWMSFEEMDEYLSLNTELITNISNFLDSTLVAIPSFNVQFKTEILEPALADGSIKLIEEPSAISVNIFGVLSTPNFLEMFLGYNPNPNIELSYYRYQVERFTYNKKSLFELFMGLKDNSLFLSLVNAFFSDSENEKQNISKYSKLLGVENP